MKEVDEAIKEFAVGNYNHGANGDTPPNPHELKRAIKKEKEKINPILSPTSLTKEEFKERYKQK